MNGDISDYVVERPITYVANCVFSVGNPSPTIVRLAFTIDIHRRLAEDGTDKIGVLLTIFVLERSDGRGTVSLDFTWRINDRELTQARAVKWSSLST